jgi:[NiFe] hydrogenase diaphorase moiety large subunit
MDILIDTQDAFGFIQANAADQIAESLDISSVDLEQTISFYHFFSQQTRGKYTIYLNNSAVANMHGRRDVARALKRR